MPDYLPKRVAGAIEAVHSSGQGLIHGLWLSSSSGAAETVALYDGQDATASLLGKLVLNPDLPPQKLWFTGPSRRTFRFRRGLAVDPDGGEVAVFAYGDFGGMLAAPAGEHLPAYVPAGGGALTVHIGRGQLFGLLFSHGEVDAQTVALYDGRDTTGTSLGRFVLNPGQPVQEEWLVGPERKTVTFGTALTVDPDGCEVMVFAQGGLREGG